jgi:transposase InsO family protein
VPWKELNIVDERRAFIAEWLKRKEGFGELCDTYGISRKTGYKWVQRFYDGGISGLLDRSRRPHRLVNKVSEEIEEVVVKARERYPTWGPKKLKAWLAKQDPETRWPAESTIGALLKRRGLVLNRRKRTRTPHQTQPLAAATEPNAVWTTDFKGAYRVAGKYCHPLTIADAHSRFLLKLHPLEGERFSLVQPVFERVFREYGMPYRIRSDNGSPFASRQSVGGLSRLAVWWVRLGITPELIEPGHPEQNGRHERMHRTMKAEGVHPGRSREGEQERLLEQFRVYYNEERPHEALGQRTPTEVYNHSPRTFPEDLPEPEYPREFVLRRVQKEGHFTWNGCRTRVGKVLGGQEIGVEPISDGRWQVWFGPIYLGLIVDEGRRKSLFLKNDLKENQE